MWNQDEEPLASGERMKPLTSAFVPFRKRCPKRDLLSVLLKLNLPPGDNLEDGPAHTSR
jgi:hypothetical protein